MGRLGAHPRAPALDEVNPSRSLSDPRLQSRLATEEPMIRIAVSSVLALSILAADNTARAAGSSPPAPTAAATPAGSPSADPELAAQRARTISKGKRLQWIGLSFSFAGVLLALGSSLASPRASTTTIACASTGVVLAFGGLGMTIAGFRRIRHPEKFARRAQLAVAPWAGRTGGGASLALRF
jgi:hypothetical protein